MGVETAEGRFCPRIRDSATGIVAPRLRRNHSGIVRTGSWMTVKGSGSSPCRAGRLLTFSGSVRAGARTVSCPVRGRTVPDSVRAGSGRTLSDSVRAEGGVRTGYVGPKG